ncbi:hypothetical protein QYF61_009744 [Mycteria americana]|uniref:Uncharacterized protein n=1 Tax=Mycteria americana TaxID=33587 RepID=A0AAN7NBZ2_MYCAM|nr:hypothetical protein QYF61_009744 [Mycteria americana]
MERLGNRRQPLAEGGTGLLDLPLGVKIPLLPGSKPVFCRTQLGEKVKEVERGRKALLFYGVPVIQRSPCGRLLYSGRCSPSVWRRWGAEESSWLSGAETKRRTCQLSGLVSGTVQACGGAPACSRRQRVRVPGQPQPSPAQPSPAHHSLAQSSLALQPGCGVLCAFRRMEKSLHQPSGYFDLGDPCCRLLSTEYNSLHDPHLRAYHKRKDNLQRLKREGYITSDSKVGLHVGLIKTALIKRGSQSACHSRLWLAEGTGLWGWFPWEQK